jgi:hypothetical protein
MSFKLQLVQEIERRQLTVTEATKKCGSNVENSCRMAQKIVTLIGKTKHHLLCKVTRTKEMELEAKVKLLEKQKSLLERQAFVADKKTIILI